MAVRPASRIGRHRGPADVLPDAGPAVAEQGRPEPLPARGRPFAEQGRRPQVFGGAEDVERAAVPGELIRRRVPDPPGPVGERTRPLEQSQPELLRPRAPARTGRSLPVAANARCVVGLGSERRSHSSGVSVRRGGPRRRRPPVLGVRPDAGSVGRVPDAIPRRIPEVRARRRVRRVRPGARRRGAARRLPAARPPRPPRDPRPEPAGGRPHPVRRRTKDATLDDTPLSLHRREHARPVLDRFAERHRTALPKRVRAGGELRREPVADVDEVFGRRPVAPRQRAG